jgi:hypothetical protein
MKKVALLLLVIFLGCSGGYVVYDRQQSAAKISASLDEVRATLKEAQDEEAQYSSGLIKALISVRIQVLALQENEWVKFDVFTGAAAYR